jgi:hypothetical protein
MKKINLILLLLFAILQASSQNTNDDLPVEFKNVAIDAFKKASPATTQWFIDMAKRHPAGNFDANWAKEKIKQKFGDQYVNKAGELMIIMMAYQRLLNKEAREDKKIAGENKRLAMIAKEEKLKADNAKIDQMKQESQEKADNKMTAANNELWIGIVSGNYTLAAAGGFEQGKTKQQVNNNAFPKVDSPKLRLTNINNELKTQQTEKKEADKSREHQNAMKDAVKKLIDQMGEINRSIRL